MTARHRALVSEPGGEVLLGLAGLVLTGLSVDDDHVSRPERVVFRVVNELPDRLYRPAWLVMQAGTIGAVPVAAAAAYLSGRRGLAGRLLATGTSTWLLAKAVKRVYRRPRPAELLATACCRGEAATGMGFVSGHAGIAVTLALGAWPELTPGWRAAVAVVAPLVGVTRVYVGAHLPLDVVGGAALGATVDGLLRLMASPTPPRGR